MNTIDPNQLFSILNKKHILQSEYETDTAKLQHEINSLDKGGMKFLTPEDIGKKYRLQNLLAQRRATNQKELQFLDTVAKYREQYMLNQKQQVPNRQERENLLKLKLQHEQILTEKSKILKEAANPNVFTSAGMAIFQDVSQSHNYNAVQSKLHQDQARIQYLKQIPNQPYENQEYEEILNSGPGDNVYNEAKFIYKGSMGRNQRDQLEQLQKLRYQLEEYNGGNTQLILPFEEVSANKAPELNSKQYLNDIDQLRNDYVKAGGTDPSFMLNLNNLEKSMNNGYFSKSNIFPTNNNTNINNGYALNSNPYPSPYTNTNPNLNPYSNPYVNRSTSVASFHSQPQPNVSRLSGHPIYQYLPNSFKNDLLAMQGPTLPEQAKKTQNNEPQTADEITLDYLRNQEAELLLSMSRLDSRTAEHQQLMGNYRELLKLRATIEKQIFDKRVQDAIKKDEKHRKNLIKGNINLFDRHARAVHYSQTEGFVMYFDYISNLEIQYHTCRVNFGIFRKGSDMYPYKQTKDAQSAFETYRTNKVVIFERELTRDLESFPDTYVFIELWGFQSDAPEVIGWSMFRLFDDESKIYVGRYRVPFYSKRLNPSFLFSQALPYVNQTMLYLRVCLPGDPILDSSDVILVESEYNMPEMHIHTTAHMTQLAEIQNVYLKELDQKDDQARKSIPAVDLQTSKYSASQLPSGGTTGRNTTKNIGNATNTSRFTKKSLKSKNITPSSSKSGSQFNSNSPFLVFRLAKLSKLVADQYNDLKLKLGIFFGPKLLEDVQQQPQMALLDLQKKASDPDELNFATRHDFTVNIDWLLNFRGEECMIFMGFFRDKKDLFGWLAIPLFVLDETQEYAIKLGAYQTNLLAPPGQSPPFNNETMKKQEIEISFFLMTTEQKILDMPLFDTYVNLNQSAVHNISKVDQSVFSKSQTLSVPTIFQQKGQTDRSVLSQSQQQKQVTIKLVLESINNLPMDGEYALKVAIACGEKLLYDVNDKACALTTQSFTSEKGILYLSDYLVEFQVDFSSEKNKNPKKENSFALIYVVNRNETITWYAHDLYKFGRYQLSTLELPWQKPPINKMKFRNSPSMTISFDLKQIK